MRHAPFAIRIIYSAIFLGTLACSTAKPSGPSQKVSVSQTPSNTSPDASATKADEKKDTSKTAEQAPVVPAPPAPATPAPAAGIALTSSAFANMAPIPLTYVAAAQPGGQNMSPPLQWKNAPAGTGSFAIQMVDLDNARLHWMISNIPASSTLLPAAVPGGNNLAAPAEAIGANQLTNYGGPNPPNLHRYEWTIYAIKQGQTLTLTNNTANNRIELDAKSLGKASLIGTYQP